MPDHLALIDAARQGDESALARLLQECQPDLRKIASRQCASEADAEDAVQETLLMVYRRIGVLRTAGSYWMWVFAILRNECRRLMRRSRARSTPSNDDNDIRSYYARPDLRVDLIDAFQTMPEKYREVIVLHDLEQHSVAEIAERLRLSQSAVKSRVHRGRRMIRDYLAG